MIPDEVKKVAASCRHYAMCKIDYLDTGLCPSAGDGNFVTYYPQGRMDVYHALAEGRIPVTGRLVDIAETCTLCGICDKQCYFITGLRPGRVMKALKQKIESHVKAGREIAESSSDAILRDLQDIVGDRWASTDPAILIAYADDPCPLTPAVSPGYVVVPGTAEEVTAIVKLCNRRQLPFAVRGNGGSVMGFVMSPGVVMDMNRMREISIDTENWVAHVGPGVAAFDLQKEVRRLGYRINAAEPAAMVAANLMCSGIFSLFSASYGIGADNFVRADFVAPDGTIFSTNDRQAPNLFAYNPEGSPLPGICTRVSVKLHPVLDDEAGVLVPFSTFAEALSFAAELSRRNIGLAIGVVGGEYAGTFMAPTDALAVRLKQVFSDRLGIGFFVLVIGGEHDLAAIRRMKVSIIDNRLFRMMMLGLPNLVDSTWLNGIADVETEALPFELIADEEMKPLVQTALDPSPETLSGVVEADLQSFFVNLYNREEMTDLVWLNTFRILSCRMGRHKHVVAFILYVPLDKPAVIEEIMTEFRRIGDHHGITNDYGFITPLDEGKRAVFEYDYYVEQTDEEDRERMRQAMPEIDAMIESFCARVAGVRWIKYTLYQGFCRTEELLYGDDL